MRYANVHSVTALVALTLPVHAGAAGSDSPAWTIGPVNLRPSGFLEYIGVRRNTPTGTGIRTLYAETPLGSGPAEWQGSPAHSRVALEAGWRAGGHWLAYYESDFLQRPGLAPYRLRQLWGEYARDGWSVVAGQAWSLLRPNRSGISARNDLMNTIVVEPGYHVGLAGARRRQVRVTRRLASWHLAAAYEDIESGALTFKLAQDRRRLHWELVGLRGAGGRMAAGIATVFAIRRDVRWVSQQLWSQGIGPELVGPMPPRVHAHAVLHGLEATLPRARAEVFAYGGLAYAARGGENRLLRQWSAGVHRELFRHAGIGSMVVSFHYSWLERHPWPGGRGTLNTIAFRLRHTFELPFADRGALNDGPHGKADGCLKGR